MDMTAEVDHIAEFVRGRRVGFVGKLGGMNRREAYDLVRQSGGTPVDQLDDRLDIIVIGADELPAEDDTLISDKIRDAAARGQIEIINEDVLWNRAGLVDNQQDVRRLYTPAMLAQLVNVPVTVIRRWHRKGLIVASREVHKLPYFDFQEVATARHIAELLDSGTSSAIIERKLQQLARAIPTAERPLAQLTLMVEGRRLLLRQGDGLVEPGGQRLFDFDDHEDDAGDSDPACADDSVSETIAFQVPSSDDTAELTPDDMVNSAVDFEAAGQFDSAAEMYRAALMAGGIDADVCFRLAELLYLQGDLTAARERYSVAIELDEDFVEARSNLGCLLAELGETELAIASFRGVIKCHPEYPDVHYHLARILDESDEADEADDHWREFLALAPDSPWADEARQRLGFDSTVGSLD
ncbi:MAG: tetratricopeptide repeat protein [Planctomycetales bacterium]|nr:tetratricopeptide repeat protein [Planctomycetales bacterium]